MEHSYFKALFIFFKIFLLQDTLKWRSIRVKSVKSLI